jgi:hypothetical protein
MAEDQRLSAVEYIDRFFDELREEVRSNPRLAARLVKALGGNVVFEDEAKSEVVNPMILAAGPKARFYAVYSAMKPAEIKKVLKQNNLATAVDMNGKTPAQLVDMLYDRAYGKVSERKSSMF